MKKVIYLKSFEDGTMKKTEKVCENFDDFIRTFDECVGSFKDICEEYGDFFVDNLFWAEGNALGINYRVEVVNE